MNIRFSSTSLLAFVLIWTVPGCGFPVDKEQATSQTEAMARPIVYATSFLISDFARQLSGNQIDLRPAVSENVSSIDWKPALNDVRRLQAADLLLINGAGYEPWLQTLTLPKSRLVDTSAGYADQLIAIQNSVTHQHGPQGSDAGGTKAWATWLDPELAMAQLHVIEGQLKRLVPDSATSITAKATMLANQLEKLDTSIQQLRQQTSDRQVSVIVDGPIYDYLIRRLGWNIRPASNADTPTTNAEEPISPLSDSSLTLCFVNRASPSLVNSKLRESCKVADIPVVEIDLCEFLPSDSDNCIQAFESNIKRIASALQQGEN